MKRVYFIKPVGLDGPIKVGCSASPDGRRSTLETWSPFALEIVAEIDGDFHLEHRFHALFMETHLRREWFGWSRRIQATIDAVKNGSFDVSTLPAPISAAAQNRKRTPNKPRQPIAKFAHAIHMRRQTLRRHGMPADAWTVPYFVPYGYSDGPFAHSYPVYDDIEATVRDLESQLDAISEKWATKKLPPVRWAGPFPEIPATRKAA